MVVKTTFHIKVGRQVVLVVMPVREFRALAIFA
jgi:hypothetical protein